MLAGTIYAMKLDDPRITTYLPVAILIAFALAQIDRAYRHDESPWNGGGFGMFSTNDRVSLRKLRAYALRDGKEERLQLGRRLGTRVKIATSFPIEGNLIALGKLLSGYEALDDATGVRVEVWRTRFDSATATASLEKIRAATYQKPN